MQETEIRSIDNNLKPNTPDFYIARIEHFQRVLENVVNNYGPFDKILDDQNQEACFATSRVRLLEKGIFSDLETLKKIAPDKAKALDEAIEMNRIPVDSWIKMPKKSESTYLEAKKLEDEKEREKKLAKYETYDIKNFVFINQRLLQFQSIANIFYAVSADLARTKAEMIQYSIPTDFGVLKAEYGKHFLFRFYLMMRRIEKEFEKINLENPENPEDPKSPKDPGPVRTSNEIIAKKYKREAIGFK